MRCTRHSATMNNLDIIQRLVAHGLDLDKLPAGWRERSADYIVMLVAVRDDRASGGWRVKDQYRKEKTT